jgi:hypothetical protein
MPLAFYPNISTELEFKIYLALFLLHNYIGKVWKEI